MGIERESFVGNPNKQEYIDDDYDELEFISDAEMELNPLGLPMGDPDLIVIHDLPDMASDDDNDEGYNPADDYELFFSDTDYDCEYDMNGDEPSDENSEDLFGEARSSSDDENYEQTKTLKTTESSNEATTNT